MRTEYASEMIWELAVELVFDCFFSSLTYPNRTGNPVVVRTRESGSLLLNHIRADLWRLERGVKRPFFEMAQRFLDELDLQLQIAVGLGFLNNDHYQRLIGQVRALESLMGVASQHAGVVPN